MIIKFKNKNLTVFTIAHIIPFVDSYTCVHVCLSYEMLVLRLDTHTVPVTVQAKSQVKQQIAEDRRARLAREQRHSDSTEGRATGGGGPVVGVGEGREGGVKRAGGAVPEKGKEKAVSGDCRVQVGLSRRAADLCLSLPSPYPRSPHLPSLLLLVPVHSPSPSPSPPLPPPPPPPPPPSLSLSLSLSFPPLPQPGTSPEWTCPAPHPPCLLLPQRRGSVCGLKRASPVCHPIHPGTVLPRCYAPPPFSGQITV